jgi:hypothetical protein
MSRFVAQAGPCCGGQFGRLLAWFEMGRNRPTQQKLVYGHPQAAVGPGSSLELHGVEFEVLPLISLGLTLSVSSPDEWPRFAKIRQRF